MVGAGKDLCGSSSPTPCQSRVTYSRLHRTTVQARFEYLHNPSGQPVPVICTWCHMALHVCKDKKQSYWLHLWGDAANGHLVQRFFRQPPSPPAIQLQWNTNYKSANSISREYWEKFMKRPCNSWSHCIAYKDSEAERTGLHLPFFDIQPATPTCSCTKHVTGTPHSFRLPCYHVPSPTGKGSAHW